MARSVWVEGWNIICIPRQKRIPYLNFKIGFGGDTAILPREIIWSLLSEKWHKKSRKPLKDFLLGGAAGGRQII